MGAPKGNEYWKKRGKDGRDKEYKTPQELLEQAMEYFKFCDENPWMKNEAIKGGQMAGEIINVPIQRPYTLEGFALFAGLSYQGFLNYGEKESHKDFFEVYTYIRQIVEQNQLEGAAVGCYNASIIARKLGLADKKELTNPDGKLTPTYNVIVSSEEVKKNLDKLNQ